MGYYESALERDMMELIRFDSTVTNFTAQPLTISFFAKDGKECTYTPDGLITFADKKVAPILYEIKYREDFRANWRVLMPKFRAAKKYCAENGCNFHIYTEKEIRTPYLTNVKFLWPFIARSVDLDIYRFLIDSLQRLEFSTPERMLQEASIFNFESVQITPVLWHLIAIGKIQCDLQVPLTLSTRIWPSREDCYE